MNSASRMFKDLLKKGFKITIFSTGKPFDPSTQKRTTVKDDILNKTKRRKNGKSI